MSERARIFISCGQRKVANLSVINSENVNLTTPEFTVAKEIKEKLEQMGFEPYIALEQQTLEGVKDAIFKRLKNTEYFLFVDFRREGLRYEDKLFNNEYRGSLFSNQELAIATFQEYEVLAFQEKGVRSEDGILKFIQANCITFSDRKSLPSLVAQKVKERRWNPNWRNELAFEREINESEDHVEAFGAVGRLFPIRIINRHKYKIARHCVAFAERIKNLQTNQTTILQLAELKWKNTIAQDVSISPQQFRCLEGIHVNVDYPQTVWLSLNHKIVDWERLHTNFQIRVPGEYEIHYVVFSENLPPARAKFYLRTGTKMQDIIFRKSV